MKLISKENIAVSVGIVIGLVIVKKAVSIINKGGSNA